MRAARSQPFYRIRNPTMAAASFDLDTLLRRDYQHGFYTPVEADTVPVGLDEDVIRFISAKKNEPEFMLDWRLRAYRHWLKLGRTAGEPKWANVKHPPIDYQTIVYYSAP